MGSVQDVPTEVSPMSLLCVPDIIGHVATI